MFPPAAGQDATEAFFGLHRHEVLLKPQYARLQIGTIEGEEEEIPAPKLGALSKVPYAEPIWLTEGFSSPFFSKNHREFQAEMRKFMDEVIYPDAMVCRISKFYDIVLTVPLDSRGRWQASKPGSL